MKHDDLVSYIKYKGKTVTEVAKELDVDRATIYYWSKLRSYPPLNYVINLCTYFNADIRVITGLFVGGK